MISCAPGDIMLSKKIENSLRNVCFRNSALDVEDKFSFIYSTVNYGRTQEYMRASVHSSYLISISRTLHSVNLLRRSRERARKKMHINYKYHARLLLLHVVRTAHVRSCAKSFSSGLIFSRYIFLYNNFLPLNWR